MTWVAVSLIVIAVAVVATAYAVSFNRLEADANGVRAAWATVDVELQRRHNLVPALVASVREIAAQERAVLERAASANAQAVGTPREPMAANSVEPPLAAAVAEVVALREQYPALDSQRSFLRLQEELATTEDRIAAARRYYNTQVAQLARRCEAFPSNLIARRHQITPAAYLDL